MEFLVPYFTRKEFLRVGAMRPMEKINMKGFCKSIVIFMLVFVEVIRANDLPTSTKSTPGNPLALLQGIAILPPETPSAAEAPLSPRTRLQPAKSPCEAECAAKCSGEEYSLVYPFCYRICTQRCTDIPTELLYDCTNTCAKSMPKFFISDVQKIESYGNACYKYCLKNAMAYATDDDTI